MRKSLWHREDKKKHQKHTQINYSVDPVTLHQVKVCVPQFVGNWVDWVYLRFWGTTLPSMERSGGCRSRRITSSCWGHWCVFLRCWGSDKEKQGHLNSTEDRYRKSLKEAMWMYTGKRQWKFLVLTSVKYFTSVYDFKKNNWGFDQSTDSNCHLG